MEIEQDAPVNTYLNDIGLLISFIRAHNNTLSEYIRVARMYLFGTPIRRMGSGFRCVTPGCAVFTSYNNSAPHILGIQMHSIEAVLQQAKQWAQGGRC